MVRSLTWLICSAVLLIAGVSKADDTPYVVGLEPTLGQETSQTEGAILATYLSKALGHPVEARAFASYDDLANAVGQGAVDIAWLNPYAFVKASQKATITPVVKAIRHGESYRSVFFVRSDSKVRRVSDLKGMKVAWVDPTSTAGYLFPVAALRRSGTDPSTFFASQTFAGSHKAVCEAVLSGAVDAGATFHTGTEANDFRPDGCLVTLGPQVEKQLVGIAASARIPNEVIAVTKNVSQDTALALERAMLTLGDSDDGREVLRVVFHADGFKVALESDFVSIRAAAELVERKPTAEEAKAEAAEPPYVIGLEPTLAEAISLPEGRVLAKYLSTELHHPVESRVFSTYDELTEALVRNEIDFAWINPYAFVKASEKADVTPLATALRHGDSYRAVFFVRAGSKVHSLADLKGLKVAWVDRTSAAGYLFPRQMLAKEQLDPASLFAKETFAGSHKGVCETVLTGVADVGATFHTGTEAGDLRPDGCAVTLGKAAERLVGIAASDPIPNEVIAASPGLDKGLGRRIAGAFTSMNDSEAGRQILRAIFHAEGFGPASNSDFDAVRAAAEAIGTSSDQPALNTSTIERPYVVGLEPTLSESATVPEAHVLATYLSDVLRHPVESRIFTSYDELSTALASGDVDFAWINPYAFVKASAHGHVVPLAKAIRHGEFYRSVLFVRADSKIRSMKDIKGAKVAWVDPASTAGYLYPVQALVKMKLDPDKVFTSRRFMGSHKGVCEAVLSGEADVGATFHTGTEAGQHEPDGCIVTLGPKAGEQLRSIGISGPIPNEVIAASPVLPENVSSRVASAFLGMSDSEAGRQVLRVVFHADGFGLAHDADFDVVRKAAAGVPETEFPKAAVRKRPYVIGLEPTLTATVAASAGKTLEKYLSSALGQPVEAHAFKTYSELNEALAKGLLDFAWINPYSFVKVAQKMNLTPLAKAIRRGDTYRAVFFTRAGSKVRDLADMKGLRVAWVDPASTAGYLFPRLILLRQEISPVKFFRSERFLGSHRAVCEAVLSGAADVGATFHDGDEPDDFRPDGCLVTLGAADADRFRGIASSERIPNEVIAAAPYVDADVALKLGSIFRNMSESEAGRYVLEDVFHADGFGAALESDFEPVRQAARELEHPSAPKPAPEKATMVLQVHFDPGVYEISTDAYASLNQLVQSLKTDPQQRVLIDGHTDTMADAELNLDLSWRRAAAVRNYLMEAGIAAERLTTRGFGMTRPAATNETEEGRAANRRVEISLVRSGEPAAPAGQLTAKCDHAARGGHYAVFSVPGLGPENLGRLVAYECRSGPATVGADGFPAQPQCQGPLQIQTWGNNVAAQCGSDAAEVTVTLITR